MTEQETALYDAMTRTQHCPWSSPALHAAVRAMCCTRPNPSHQASPDTAPAFVAVGQV